MTESEKCPFVTNQLNAIFVDTDGRYVAQSNTVFFLPLPLPIGTPREKIEKQLQQTYSTLFSGWSIIDPLFYAGRVLHLTENLATIIVNTSDLFKLQQDLHLKSILLVQAPKLPLSCNIQLLSADVIKNLIYQERKSTGYKALAAGGLATVGGIGLSYVNDPRFLPLLEKTNVVATKGLSVYDKLQDLKERQRELDREEYGDSVDMMTAYRQEQAEKIERMKTDRDLALTYRNAFSSSNKLQSNPKFHKESVVMTPLKKEILKKEHEYREERMDPFQSSGSSIF